MNTPILITGGTGLVGVNLVRHLTAGGKRVRLLVRPASSRVGLDSDLLELMEGDITDPQSVRRAVAGCKEVYHLAAWVQISPWGRAVARKVNVGGTRNICEAALAAGVRRLVHTSSIATIGSGSIESPGDEDTPWNVPLRGCPYHATKFESERVVAEFIRKGLDAVIVNPTWVVGPWDIKPSAGRVILRVAARRMPFYPPRGGINYVDVRNVASGHQLAMEKGSTGERYILGGENQSYREFLECVARLAGVKAPRQAPPYALVYPIAAIGSLLGRVAPQWFRDANLTILKSAYEEHYVSSAKACRDLGYRPTPVEEAVRDALNWFKDYGYWQPREPLPSPDAA